MTAFVDTHCHLDLEAFDDDRSCMLERARRSGVGAMLLIGFNPDRWVTTGLLCDEHDFLKRAVGLHPNDAMLWGDDLEQALVEEIERTAPLAIGETGLDFYRSSESRSIQVVAFRCQLELARSFGLPVVIHQRAAERDMLKILEEFAPLDGVIHCFSGDEEFARECLDLGMYLGIGGVATFPKSDDVRQALANMPPDRLLLETDAPFLAPQSHRGKRNEPAFLVEVARVVATELGITIEELSQLTTSNATELFGAELSRAVLVETETV